MLYESYKENLMYSGQRIINFPKVGESGGKPGFGSVVFLMCPNRDKSIKVINSDELNFNGSLFKHYITDGIYREKIGTKRINSLEKSGTDKFFKELENFKLLYVPQAQKDAIINKKRNIVYDLSRWMEIFFTRADKLPVQKKCSEFIRILSSIMGNSSFDDYNKILLVDINSWASSIKSCVIMNKKLLNNPLSILLYTACYFPELLGSLPNIRMMIVNRDAGQLFITNIKEINKKNYSKYKSKMTKFKDIAFSAEDEIDSSNTSEESIQNEVSAEISDTVKSAIKQKAKSILTSNPNKPEDITSKVSSPSILDKLDEESSEEDDVNTVGFNLDEEVSKNIEDELQNENPEDADIEDIALTVADKVSRTTYKASFVPKKSPAEEARIERLASLQKTALPTPTMDDVKRKTISVKPTGEFIKTTNPNIKESKFANFDKEYASKCLPKNIDDAIAALSNASDPIFVTDTSIEDSSDSMNLKELHTYKLEDAKGNKMVVSFDVPKVIDGTYIYINGTTKCIRHQFILKPIVKTSPDAVQIVTSYKKVFVYRLGSVNQNINRLKSYMEANPQRFKIKAGNCSIKNAEYEVPLDYLMLSKYFAEFTDGDRVFYMSIDDLCNAYKKMHHKELSYDKYKELPVAINMKTKEAIMLPLGESYTELVMNGMSSEDTTAINKIKRKPKFVCAWAKMMGRYLPVILFTMFCEGWASVMKKADIEWQFIHPNEKRNYDPFFWDTIPLKDGLIVWKKTPFRNELLMNGFKSCDLSDFTFEELESKETYISLILSFFPGNNKIFYALDNFRDFLIDPKTKEILSDLGYPTGIVELFIFAADLLTDTKYKIENNLDNMRIRSSEVISDMVYDAITSAYTAYRNTAYKKKPTKVSLKKSIIIDKLTKESELLEEHSVLNPILELEKARSVTFKGIRGIQLDRAMTLPRRAYDRSMLGTVGITTSPDKNCGVVRQLTLEPQIISTYGYVDTSKSADTTQLNAANLFTPAELLQPMGVIHDDPDRTSMSYKQSKAMIPINDADPVLIGNKVEAVIPYHMTNEFVVNAEDDGECISVDENFAVVKYKNGKNYAIEIAPRVRKNSSSGFWIDNTLKCDLKVGSKFKKGDILAYNDKHFSSNKDDNGVSMNAGALCKIAISSQWDVFEDSAPISRRLSEKLASTIVEEKHINLSPYTHVDKIVNVGDPINAGEPLIVFSDAIDPEMQVLLAKMREENKEAVLESAKTTVASKYTGTIADIKMYTTADFKELDPSLQKLIKAYWKRINAKNAVLDKYKNEDDLNYYKAGQIIKEITDIVQPSNSGKIAGYEMRDNEVMILFYIKYDIAASKGDKVVCSVCKGVVSHVIEEGMEPYSEYRPEETIDTIVAPLAVSARKVPTIFLTIFGNKLIIELKRQLKDIFEKGGDIKTRRKKMMDHLCKCMDMLDPTGANAKIYKDKYSTWDDHKFEREFKAFFKDEKQNLYLEIVEYERDLTIEQITECAKYMNVPLCERVAFPYLSGDSSQTVVTPTPVPVGYIHERRMSQTLQKKSAGSTSIKKRSPLSGQVTSEDKNARVSDLEAYSLATINAKEALTEFMNPRADNQLAKQEMYNDIAKNGYVSLKDLSLRDPYNKVTLNTYNTYWLMMGIGTNLVTDLGEIPGPKE